MIRRVCGVIGLTAFSCVYSVIAQEQPFAPVQTLPDIKAQINFLVSPINSGDQVGFSYRGTAGELAGRILPLSYYSTPKFWGEYVGGIAGNDLTVVDLFNSSDYTVAPEFPNSPPGILQFERVNAYNGSNIYDAACWQIALAIGAAEGLTGPAGEGLFQLAENQNLLLKVGYNGNATAAQVAQGALNRATTRPDGTFTYNGIRITDPKNAYHFRMVARNWLSADPFKGTGFIHFVTAPNLPRDNPDYQLGLISWADWKPITGENAWAFFIGPLQTAMLKARTEGRLYIPSSSLAIENATGALFALSALQSAAGGIYYVPRGSLGNEGEAKVNPYEISVENNASALAGLLIFKNILENQITYGGKPLSNEPAETAEQLVKAKATLDQVKVMIYGGTNVHGKMTKGLLAFFKNDAWDAHSTLFLQGGDGRLVWTQTQGPKAVDVNTWGVTALGQPTLDSWFGFGTAYNNWQAVKKFGGYFGPDGTIWGVGYSDVDDHKVISAEWSAGAINMLRCLITQYGQIANSNSASAEDRNKAQDYVRDLTTDHDSMYQRLMTLRTDRYPIVEEYAQVRPPQPYAELIPIPNGKQAFLYANKRYKIPFGWWANPLPSTTSTAWAMMLHYNFNPLGVGGGYSNGNLNEQSVALKRRETYRDIGFWTPILWRNGL